MDNSVLSRGFRLLQRAIRDEPWTFGIAVAGSILFSLSVIGSAFVLGALVERVIEPAFASDDTTFGALAVAALALLGVASVKIMGILGRRIAGGLMGFRLFAAYRRRLARKFLRLSPRWHADHSTGSLLSAVSSDVETAFTITAPLPFAVGTLALIVVSLVALALVDWLFLLVALVLFPAIFLLTYTYSRVIAPRARAAQQAKARVASAAHESFDGALVVKTLGAEEPETERFGVRAAALRDAQIAVGRVRGVFDPLMETFPSLATLSVLLVGAIRVNSDTLQVADVVMAAYLFTVLAMPLRAIGWILGDMPRAVAGWDRVAAILRADEEVRHGTTRLAATGPATLTLQDVSVAYRSDVDPVLRGVNLEVGGGRTVALVGATGAGKSTIVGAAARLLDPTSGSVLIDGVAVHELAPGELSRQLAWVSQTAFIFDDTVANNVTLGEDFTDTEIWEALRITHLDEVARALPEGLDTRIGERGASFSGGQRQRLALARAVIRRPRLLLLDDATSALDPTVEQTILANLRESTAAGTVLLVAYRNSSIALADEVAFLADGAVVAQGQHDELVRRLPEYAELVTAYEHDRRPVEVVA